MRRPDRPTHEIPSFARYLNKVFDFRTATAGLQDSRQNPDISPQSVFLAAFYSFVFRLPSFQQLESDLTQAYLQHWIGSDRGFGDDVLRYSLCGFDLAGLEEMLVQINRTLKRGKAFEEGRVQGRIVAALDGVEVLSSYSRCCDSCLERRVTSRQGGVKVEQVQYYHRAVGCQIISSPVKSFLVIEWLQPGEGEDTAALRLLDRIPDLYGSRFFDILLLDALYAQAPVLRLAEKIGWDLVISLKQNQRDLYQSAIRCLLTARPIPLLPKSRRARPTKSNSGTRRGYPSLVTTRTPCGSFDPKRRSPRIITGSANSSPRPPPTNGSGSPPWTRRHFPPTKCADSVMTVGNWKTMGGMISRRTGPSSMAFCTPAVTVRKLVCLTAHASQSPTADCPLSRSSSY